MTNEAVYNDAVRVTKAPGQFVGIDPCGRDAGEWPGIRNPLVWDLVGRPKKVNFLLDFYLVFWRDVCSRTWKRYFWDVKVRISKREETWNGMPGPLQIFSGIFFFGLAAWLSMANGTKLSFIQQASHGEPWRARSWQNG